MAQYLLMNNEALKLVSRAAFESAILKFRYALALLSREEERIASFSSSTTILPPPARMNLPTLLTPAASTIPYVGQLRAPGGGGYLAYEVETIPATRASPRMRNLLLPMPMAMELDGLVFSQCHESSPDNLFNVYEKGFAFQTITVNDHYEGTNELGSDNDGFLYLSNNDDCHNNNNNNQNDWFWSLPIHQQEYLRQMQANPMLQIRIVRSVIMYNLGLATHGQGLLSGNRATVLLRQALRMYETSLTTLFESMGHLHKEDKSILLVLLATLANMGHLLSHFWFHQAAMECLWSMENYRRLPLFAALSVKDTKFFNHTVVCGRVASHRFSLAPAA